MDVSPARFSQECDRPKGAPIAVPEPTPGYGTFGPGSDIAAAAPRSAGRRAARPFVLLVAIAVAILVVVLTGRSNTPPVMWSDFENLVPAPGVDALSASHVR